MRIGQKMWVGRAQLLGDTITALPIARYYKKKLPNYHLIWPIAKKCSQAAMLYLNCPSIDEIYICDGQEGPQSKRDLDKKNSCEYIINENPDHPDNRYPLEFSIYSETWRMSGLSIDEWNKLTIEQQTPKLTKWWNLPARIFGESKTIGYFPQAGYSRENKRNMSKKKSEELVMKLVMDGYKIVQFGAETDWRLFDDCEMVGDYFPVNEDNFKRMNRYSLFDQIKYANECDLVIGTDSGSGLLMAAYEVQQVTLLTDHWGNTNNPYALAPMNRNNYNFFAPGGCDNIDVNQVIQKIKEKIL